MKSYNNLSDLEKLWIREYKQWCKCGIINLAIIQATHYANLLASHGLKMSDYA